MKQGGEMVLMRIFIGESDRHGHRPLYETLVELFKRYEIPYAAIHLVRQFDPATGQLEPESATVTVALST